jgi:hypothetical protein
MTATTKTPLGASTGNRKWYLDVDVSDTDVADWVPVLGITNFQPNADDANLEDDSDFDSGGFMSQTKTAAAWSATITVARKVTEDDVTQYDQGQEFLRGKAIGKFGVENSASVRFYEMEPGGPRIEAYTGHAAVGWAEQGGDMKALDTVQVALTGQGQLALIDHPDTAAAVVPEIGSATPVALGTAGGSLVTIRGNGFTGVTGASHVTFAGTNATAYDVFSDSLIVAIAPAHTAGTGTIVVTNPTGASTDGPTVTYS